ncbi:Nn.00g035790.m01.CDS01 [Neocucurbitaria sp. VM-36]
MSRAITTLRTRTISLLTNPPQRPFSLNIDAAKARATTWEPSLHLDALFPSKPQQHNNNTNNNNNDDNPHSNADLPLMTTYTAFDPCSPRPVLHSGLSLCVPVPSIPSLHHLGTVVQNTQEVVVTELSATTTATTHPYKPWPYRLPLFLQPQVGTTFEMVHRSRTTTTTVTTSITAPVESVMRDDPQKRISILQAVLYGISEPETFSYTKGVVKDGSGLHKVLYGVRD